MTTIREFIGTKDSGRIGTLIERASGTEYKLILRRDNSNYSFFNPVIVNSKGKSDTIRLQYAWDMPLEAVQHNLQSYLEIDNPKIFQVVLNYTKSQKATPQHTPTPKPTIRTTKRATAEFKIGDIVAIKMRSGDVINRGMVVVGFTKQNELLVYPLLRTAVDYADYVEGGKRQNTSIEVFNPEHTVKDSAFFTKKGYDTEKIREKAKAIAGRI